MARISQEQKRLNRDKIVSAAGEGFRLRGISGTGIDKLMKAAGMTHGGFYNHFSSKEELAQEVLRQNLSASLDDVALARETHADSARAALHAIIDGYVSTRHRDHPETGCASAALVADAGRHGAAIQAQYDGGLRGYITAFTEMLLEDAARCDVQLDPVEAREEAIAIFSQMVGALLVSRAVAAASPELSDEVLAANRAQLKQL